MSCKILDHVTISHHFTKRKPWVKRCEIYQHRGSLTAEEPRPENDPNIPLRLAFLIAFLMVFRGAYMPGYVVCSIPFFGLEQNRVYQHILPLLRSVKIHPFAHVGLGQNGVPNH